MIKNIDIEGFATPHYHRQLRQHLETTEPELWAWFAEVGHIGSEAIEQAELHLLKTTYRLDGGVHAVLDGVASLVASRLGLNQQVVLYQELDTGDRTARVIQLGERIHIVFSGDLLDLLTLDEQEAVIAHELAHVALQNREGAAYLILDQLISRADLEAMADDVITETARRLRLHTEVFADSVARQLVGELGPVVSSIVKVHTGLRDVDADAYLRQARQIIESDPSSSRGWTHPELHMRVACLAALDTSDADGIVAQIIDGPDDLDRLDILGQLRIQEITGRVLSSARQVAGDDESVGSYLKNYYELNLDVAQGVGDEELVSASASVKHLAAALVVDMVMAGDGDGLGWLSDFSREAARQGIGPEFDKVLSKATEQTLGEVRKLRRPR